MQVALFYMVQEQKPVEASARGETISGFTILFYKAIEAKCVLRGGRPKKSGFFVQRSRWMTRSDRVVLVGLFEHPEQFFKLTTALSHPQEPWKRTKLLQ
jgi:hypothetical protein